MWACDVFFSSAELALFSNSGCPWTVIYMFMCVCSFRRYVCVRDNGWKKHGRWNKSTSLCLCVGLHLSLCVYVCYSTAVFYCLYAVKCVSVCLFVGARLSVYQCVLRVASHWVHARAQAPLSSLSGRARSLFLPSSLLLQTVILAFSPPITPLCEHTCTNTHTYTHTCHGNKPHWAERHIIRQEDLFGLYNAVFSCVMSLSSDLHSRIKQNRKTDN